MKRLAIWLSILFLAGSSTFAAGLMKPRDGNLPELGIEEHHVNVVINNGFAVTEVDQVFLNPHDRDLDAVYTFPLPREASLSELSLWIDGQEVVGEVVEKEQARRIVQEERAAGGETALAEKRGYRAFDVFVSPVRAGSQTRVRLVYLQPIEIDGGIGRYVYPLEEGEIDEQARAFWTRRDKVDGKFTFECVVRSSYPLDEVRAKGFGPSVVNTTAPGEWTVWVDQEEGMAALDEDIVVYYRLAPDQPARVDLLPYRSGDGPGTYMMIITPGADLKPIVEGTDWTVVLDTSGSMSAKIATAGDAVARALGEMRPEDRFRILAFSDRAREVTPGFVPVSADSVNRFRQAVLGLSSNGGTNLYRGFEAGLAGLDADRTSAVIVVSDGGANVGPTEQRDFLSLIEKKDVRVFTFVMGQGANRPLLRRLAEESGGFTMDVSNRDDLYGRLVQARAKMAREALHGVEVEIEGVGIAEPAPARVPSLYFGQQLVRFGRYLEPGDVNLRLSARISGEKVSWQTRIHLPERDETFPEIERLWALARVQDLGNQMEAGGDATELREAIVDLGTAYSIVTDHTSMVVVREQSFEERGIDRRNGRRVETERNARKDRAGKPAVATRADRAQPMFGDNKAHDVGGAGAVGPFFLVVIAGLYGARRWTRRRQGSGR